MKAVRTYWGTYIASVPDKKINNDSTIFLSKTRMGFSKYFSDVHLGVVDDQHPQYDADKSEVEERRYNIPNQKIEFVVNDRGVIVRMFDPKLKETYGPG
ncbi:MAG: hypothetical protein QXU44_04685 [Candidatus Caldarchaeum sp.]